MNIKGAVAVITGACGGIGKALAEELTKRGVQGMALVDRSPAIDEAVSEMNRLAGRPVAAGFFGDVTNADFRRHVFEEAKAKFGPVNICVPAAAITRDKLAVSTFKETHQLTVYPIEMFREVVEVNLTAPVYWGLELVAGIAQERARLGLKRWEPAEPMQGSVVFIGSVSSGGNKGQIAYSTTKAGLEGAAATLAIEAIFYGVRCGVIHPGFTDTPMVRALGQKFIDEHIIPNTHLRRLIRPEEIADAICFMVSNAAVNGPLWADAGWRSS